MDRRTFTKKAGSVGLLTASTLAAGCSQLGLGGGTPLEVPNVDTSTTATGDIVVSPTINNPTEQSQSATMTTQVDVKEGETYTKEKEITVPAGNQNTYEITHNLDLGSSLTADMYEYSASVK